MKQLFVKAIACISMAGLFCHAFTQSETQNWEFGDSVGLNFSSDPPLIINSVITSFEACSSVSDSLGNLLFYTNGETVWNRNNTVMSNGDSLDIGQEIADWQSSITQGVIIIPDPGNNMNYYIFQLQNYGLEYSIIDMTLDGGLGNVVIKNESLIYQDTVMSEKLAAVRSGNGRDWWLLLHEWRSSVFGLNSYKFVRFLITPYGIAGPYIQDYGIITDSDSDNYFGFGQMKFSPSGNQLAFTRGKYVDLYYFDRCNGELSNHKCFYVGNTGTYGCEFSADGRLLYIVTLGTGSQTKLFQFCINCGIDDINSTEVLIYKNMYNDYWIGQLQAEGSKIYMTLSYNVAPNNIFSDINKNLSVINDPNIEGLSCDFDTLSISLGSHRCKGGLPNFPDYGPGRMVGSPCDTIGMPAGAVQFGTAPEPAVSLGPNPVYKTLTVYLAPGTGACMFHLYDPEGKIVFSAPAEAPAQSFDLSFLAPGIYFYTIPGKNRVLLQGKLVKE